MIGEKVLFPLWLLSEPQTSLYPPPPPPRLPPTIPSMTRRRSTWRMLMAIACSNAWVPPPPGSPL